MILPSQLLLLAYVPELVSNELPFKNQDSGSDIYVALCNCMQFEEACQPPGNDTTENPDDYLHNVISFFRPYYSLFWLQSP
jgi:hypothetical protein